MLSLQEKIDIIENSNSFAELGREVLPTVHKENYYFVSYSHKDYKKVIKDILLLQENGVNIWYDSDMHIGDNWEDIAEMYISKFQCKGIIFYLSENSILSKACNKEVDYVIENNKQFFSINIPLEGDAVCSGLEMAIKLKEKGFDISDSLLESFNKTFSDKMLYLSYGDSIERKKEQIEKLVGEDMFVIDSWFSVNYGSGSMIKSSKDNSFVTLDLKTNYQINQEDSRYFGQTYPLGVLDKAVFANSFKLREATLPKTVYEICEYAFINCHKLKKINLSGLDYIRDSAFYNCMNLDIPSLQCKFIGKNAFQGCNSLTDVTIDANEIGAFAFYACKKLQRVRFKENLLSIKGYAFEYCENLSEIYFDSDTPNSIVKKEGDIYLHENCFANCKKITEFNMEGNVNLKEANGVFSFCSNLKTLTIKIKSLREIPSFFCSYCDNLISVQGLEKVKIFGDNAFFKCWELSNVNISKAKRIGDKAFAGCSLKEIILNDVESVGELAFDCCDKAERVYIGNKIKFVGENAFAEMPSLKEVEIYGKGVDFAVTAFNMTSPESITVCDLEILAITLDGGNENLKVVYVEKDLISLEDLNGLASVFFDQVESDKEGFDKFLVNKSNKYAPYVHKDVIVTLKNDERIFTYCSEAGFDEERQEFFIVAGDKYYESEISDVCTENDFSNRYGF